MRRIKQLLTMRFGAGASTRAIGRELGIAPSTVREYLGRAAAAGIGWPLAADLTDEDLVARLFVNAGVRAGARLHAEPDWSALVRELKRPGVNLLMLWDEYRAVEPQGYAYSRFCQLFREFEQRLSPTMRQQHVAGDKTFIDYSGKRVPIADPATGEVCMAEIFVAVLGASNLTYAEATPAFAGAGSGRRRCRTGLAPTCACSASTVRRRGCWFPTISRAASTRRRSTTPR
jgi:transposase